MFALFEQKTQYIEVDYYTEQEFDYLELLYVSEDRAKLEEFVIEQERLYKDYEQQCKEYWAAHKKYESDRKKHFKKFVKLGGAKLFTKAYIKRWGELNLDKGSEDGLTKIALKEFEELVKQSITFPAQVPSSASHKKFVINEVEVL